MCPEDARRAQQQAQQGAHTETEEAAAGRTTAVLRRGAAWKAVELATSRSITSLASILDVEQLR